MFYGEGVIGQDFTVLLGYGGWFMDSTPVRADDTHTYLLLDDHSSRL